MTVPYSRGCCRSQGRCCSARPPATCRRRPNPAEVSCDVHRDPGTAAHHRATRAPLPVQRSSSPSPGGSGRSRWLLSSRYRPWSAPYDDHDIGRHPGGRRAARPVRDVLRRIAEQRPDEVIVVINGAAQPGLEQVCDEFAPLVRWVHTPIAGKRNAVDDRHRAVGRRDHRARRLRHRLDRRHAAELVKPFADRRRRRGHDPAAHPRRRNGRWITRWADWLENTRALYSMPAQSVARPGRAACRAAPSRSGARSCMQVMPEFMTEQFLGVFLEVSDDRTLTNLTLKRGLQDRLPVDRASSTPTPRCRCRSCAKQQLRWARGSQYNTLRMLPWMLTPRPAAGVLLRRRHPAAVPARWPWSSPGSSGWRPGPGDNLYAGILQTARPGRASSGSSLLTVVLSALSMALRQLRHIDEQPDRLPPAAGLHALHHALPDAAAAARASSGSATSAGGAPAPAPTRPTTPTGSPRPPCQPPRKACRARPIDRRPGARGHPALAAEPTG